ncbi:SEC-C motif domain protein [Candidatus Sulfopaludibacter sp. SbA4]|nr:SEC-C motif domain protein [Candidatus Sulfopaludibacter sp. SbA4]
MFRHAEQQVPMIFPSDAVVERRRSLFARMTSGKITQEEAFRQALQADPDDITATRFLAVSALATEDYPRAERYARDLMRLHPSNYEGYFLLAGALGERDSASPLANAYLQLAYERMRDDDDALERLDTDKVAKRLGVPGLMKGLSKDEALTAFIDLLKHAVGTESEDVARELEPYRLIFKLCDSWDDLMEPGVVDAILRNGEACAPLLLGILKEWGQDLLTEDDWPVVERALALLGEIGDPAALPAILEFLIRQDDDLSGPAEWAFRRMAWQDPVATLKKIREIVPQTGSAERVTLAHQIGLMPNVPGRSEVLTSLTQGIGDLHKDEQDAVAVSAIVAVMMVEGRHSPLSSTLERQFGGVLSRESRAGIRDIRRDAPDGPFVPEPPEIPIHEICCDEPESEDDEEDSPQPFVHKAPRPGRNDPCWCGSGKKYKKCHLDQDEGR